MWLIFAKIVQLKIQIDQSDNVKFLKIVIFLQNPLNLLEQFGDFFDEDLLNFCCYNCADCSDFEELKEMIGSVKVKHNPGFKKFKFTLQVDTFVYQRLINFPSGRFDFEAITTPKLFESFHSKNVKIDLHHLHVTGKTCGYAHNFCTMKVRENQTQFSCMVHNFLDWICFFYSKEFDFWCRERKT